MWSQGMKIFRRMMFDGWIDPFKWNKGQWMNVKEMTRWSLKNETNWIVLDEFDKKCVLNGWSFMD